MKASYSVEYYRKTMLNGKFFEETLYESTFASKRIAENAVEFLKKTTIKRELAGEEEKITFEHIFLRENKEYDSIIDCVENNIFGGSGGKSFNEDGRLFIEGKEKL